MKSPLAGKAEVRGKSWFLIDAQDKVLGRLATQVADILRGKNNPRFAPHLDTGDFVVIVNARKVKLTGRKWAQKTYYRHTGYIGGLRTISAEKLLLKKPEALIRHAVKGMLPKNRLGSKLIGKLKIYAGAEHPHQAQKTVPCA